MSKVAASRRKPKKKYDSDSDSSESDGEFSISVVRKGGKAKAEKKETPSVAAALQGASAGTGGVHEQAIAAPAPSAQPQVEANFAPAQNFATPREFDDDYDARLYALERKLSKMKKRQSMYAMPHYYPPHGYPYAPIPQHPVPVEESHKPAPAPSAHQQVVDQLKHHLIRF